MVSNTPDSPVLARDLAGTVAHAGVDPTLEGRALQDALRAAIAARRGYCWWDVDHAGWVVTLSSPGRADLLRHDAGGRARLLRAPGSPRGSAQDLHVEGSL